MKLTTIAFLLFILLNNDIFISSTCGNPYPCCGSRKYCDTGPGQCDPNGGIGRRKTEGICYQCSDGMFCPGDDTMHECDKGYKCVMGLSTRCTAGTYQDQTGQTTCKSCPEGKYCSGLGQTSVSGTCTQSGYYCPEGSTSQTEHSCTVGYYCNGNGLRQICSNGYYCPAGSSSQSACGKGYYCQNGIRNNCGAGYYCDTAYLSSKKTCPAGKYCSGTNVDTPINCLSGSYCPSGSSEEGDCGKGFYCSTPSSKSSCGLGYICPGERETNPTPCPAGKYCDDLNGEIESGDCLSGYYCPSGSSSATQNICQAGSYCPSGSGSEITCQDGSHCPEGSSIETDCGVGYYCDSNFVREECPIGNICPSARETGPTLCPEGKYCSSKGLSTESGDCLPGYYCPPGSSSSQQEICPEGSYCLNGLATTCTPGEYCPAGSSVNSNCGLGYYCPNPTQKRTCERGFVCSSPQLTKAKKCPAGSYCATTGLSQATGLCPEGNYCPEGTSDPIPCASSSFCPEGSISEFGCNCNGRGSCSAEDPNDCSCNQGYGGDQCEKYQCFGEILDNLVCNGSGRCIEIDDCDCYPGYEGDQCEIYSCFEILASNTSTVCSGNGDCISSNVCKCKGIYTGQTCSIEGSQTGSIFDSPLIPVIATISVIVIVVILIVLVVLVIAIIAICCCSIKQRKKLKDYGKYDDEIEMIKLDNKEAEESGTEKAVMRIDKKHFNIEWEDLILEKKIGSGGFCDVFQVKWENNISAAFKMFKTSDFSTDNNNFEDFEKELNLMSSLSHPNIVSFYGASLKPPRVGILLEMCPGGDLKQRLMLEGSKKNPIPFKLRLEWLKQILSAISYLHKRKIIHRDLKPENILMKKNQCKLCDFGLSKILQDVAHQKFTMRTGTSFYMAPEVCLGKKYSYPCDIFSISIIMYELLTFNVEPYSFLSRKNQSIRGPPELTVANNPNVRPRFDENAKKYKDKQWYIKIMKQCWNEDPTSRMTIKEIIEEIAKNEKKMKPKKPTVNRKSRRLPPTIPKKEKIQSVVKPKE